MLVETTLQYAKVNVSFDTQCMSLFCTISEISLLELRANDL